MTFIDTNKEIMITYQRRNREQRNVKAAAEFNNSNLSEENMVLFKLTNWVSLLFLGFSFSFYLYYTDQISSSHSMAGETSKSIYDFTVKDIQGNDVKLSEYSGKVVLIVNVASKCGLTQSNYKELNVLYEKYKNKGLEILAFPCNQFGGQEPGDNEEIQEVACTRFKAEFPMFDKIEVNGKKEDPLYKFLKSEKGGIFGNGIKWNFTKFLVNKEGKVVERYAPVTTPLKIEKDIQNLLESS